MLLLKQLAIIETVTAKLNISKNESNVRELSLN